MLNKQTHARSVGLEWGQRVLSKTWRQFSLVTMFTCHFSRQERRVTGAPPAHPSTIHPLPLSSSPTPACPRWGWLLHPETGQHPASQPPHTEASAEEPALPCPEHPEPQQDPKGNARQCHRVTAHHPPAEAAQGAAFLPPALPSSHSLLTSALVASGPTSPSLQPLHQHR